MTCATCRRATLFLFVLLSTASWLMAQQAVLSVYGSSNGDAFGKAVGWVGDVDEDNHADFVVGALYDDTRATNAGMAAVFSGRDGHLIWVQYGDAANHLFGFAVAGAGDFNRDGCPDVIVGAPAFDTSNNPGYARVYSGRDGSLLSSASGTASRDNFGWAVNTARDVNLDGYADVIVGANQWSGGPGYAKVFAGPDGHLLYQFVGNPESGAQECGYSVSSAGDVNADGWPDLLVSIVNDDTGGLDAGGVRVYSGKDGTCLATIYGSRSQAFFGFDVSDLGDVNTDGHDDFLVGALIDGFAGYHAGAVFVISGSTFLTLHRLNGSSGDQLGRCVADLGDIDGDCIPDFAAGASEGLGSAGYVRIYSGRTWGTLFPDLRGDTSIDRFGTDVAGGGDEPASGWPNLLVGAHRIGAPGYARVFSLVTDTSPPVVTIDSPADGEVIGTDTVLVSAFVQDDAAVTVVSTPAGINVTLGPGGGPVTGTIPLLHEGDNLITLTATDAAGNEGGSCVVVIRDMTQPTVEIVSPSAGTVFSNSPINMTIDVRDATATTALVAGITYSIPAGGDTIFTTVPIAEGLNSIWVTVQDQAGNETTVSVGVTLDLTAPIVTIDQPLDGQFFGPNQHTVTVTGTVDDLTAVDYSSTPPGVGGSLLPGGGPITGIIDLCEGLNSITITATDAAGRQGSTTVTVILDTTAPDIAVVSPADGDSVRGEIDFDATAPDPAPGSGVASVTLWVDDGEGPYASFDAAPFETTLDTRTLSDGCHMLRAEAWDAMGNHSSATIRVLVDNTPPSLSITSPVPNAYVAGTIDFNVEASDLQADEAGSGLTEIVMRAGGAAPTLDGSTIYAPPVQSDARHAEEDTTHWPDGPLTLTVTAKDDAGNETSAAVIVIVDNTAPSRQILSPTDGDIVSGIIMIITEAADANLESIEILVDGVSIRTSSSSPFSLPFDTTQDLDGTITIQALVRDLAGNVDSCSVTVFVDNIGFVLTPATLNLKSKGKESVFAHLEGPNVAMLLPTEEQDLELHVPGGSPVLAVAGFSGDDGVSDDDGDGIPELLVRFDRQKLISAIQAGIVAGAIQPASGARVSLMASTVHLLGVDTIKLTGWR
ncbi:MAG: Ig-like domain-containing protein [Planctomycetota bacterium]